MTSRLSPDQLAHLALSSLAIVGALLLACLGRIDATSALVLVCVLSGVSAGAGLGAANLAKGVALGVPLTTAGYAAPAAADVFPESAG